MKSKIKYCFILIAMTCIGSELLAQTVDSSSVQAIVKDSVKHKIGRAPLYQRPDSPETFEKFIEGKPISTEVFVMQKSPTKAMLYSLLLPGLGQYYVESYWKAPMFLGAAGTLGGLIVYYHNEYSKKQTIWDDLDKINPDDPNKSTIGIAKEFDRDNRDMMAFYLLGVYILGAVDAYVGAHLYDFNVSDDISLQVSPSAGYGYWNTEYGVSLHVKLSF